MSFSPKTEEQKRNDTLENLIQRFSSKLDVDIIYNIVVNNNWEYEPSIRDLLQLITPCAQRSLEPPTFSKYSGNAFTHRTPNPYPHHPSKNQPRPLINDTNMKMYKPNYRGNPKLQTGKVETLGIKQNLTLGKIYPANNPNRFKKSQQDTKSKSKIQPEQAGVKHPFDRIKDQINRGHRIMILMRGCPGSGKTFYARLLIKSTIKQPYAGHIFSTDDYFERDKKTGYLFIPEQLHNAHEWNLKRVQSATDKGISPIIIDNTNIEKWEMSRYAKMAVSNSYILEILEVRTKWHRDETELARRNIHGVPKQTIHNMLERYQWGVNATNLLQQLKINYAPGKEPPIFASNFKPNDELKSQSTNAEQSEKKKTRKKRKNNKKIVEKLLNVDEQDLGKMLLELDKSKRESVNIYLEQIRALQLKEKNDQTNDAEASLEANVVAALKKKESNANSNSSLLDPDSNDNSSVSESSTDHQEQNIEEDLLDINNWDEGEPDLISLNDGFGSFDQDSWQYLLPKNIDSSNLSQSSNDMLNNTDTSKWGNWFEDFTLETQESINVGKSSNWGLENEEEWEIAKKEIIPSCLEPQRQRLPQTARSFSNIEVNTNERDKHLSHQLDSGLIREEDLTNVGRILKTNNRDINDSTSPLSSISYRTGYFNKSSMTEDIFLNTSLKGDDATIELMHMFPKIPRDEIEDLLERCGGDLDWAAKLLLETNTTERIPETSIFKHPMDISIEREPSSKPEIETTTKHRSFRQKTSLPSEEALLLKKELETNFTLNDSLYSEGTRKIRRLKQGRSFEMPPLPSEQATLTSSTSIPHLLDEDIPDELTEEEENYIPIKLDTGFVKELQNNFGASIYPFPEGSPTIDIPMSLARQLHYYLMEHLQKNWNKQQVALDQLIHEDEVLAHKLHEVENSNKQAPKLREIMDMELALAIYKADQDAETGIPNKEDLATKLSKQMLCENFPMVDPILLYDILKAHNNNYQMTIKVVQESLDLTGSPALNVMSSEALALKEKSLIERAKQESLKFVPKKSPMIIVRQTSNELTPDNSQLTIDRFRQEATNLYEKRNEYCAKAQEAFRADQYSTANYYSTMVDIYKKKINEINIETASALVALQEPNVTTLDLHYLFVREAVEVLDCFIDRHLLRLKNYCELNGPSSVNKNKIREILYLITGRGARSRQGKCRIRPAIMSRLQQRKLRFSLENPGMLKVTIYKDDLLSKEIDN